MIQAQVVSGIAIVIWAVFCLLLDSKINKTGKKDIRISLMLFPGGCFIYAVVVCLMLMWEKIC